MPDCTKSSTHLLADGSTLDQSTLMATFKAPPWVLPSLMGRRTCTSSCLEVMPIWTSPARQTAHHGTLVSSTQTKPVKRLVALLGYSTRRSLANIPSTQNPPLDLLKTVTRQEHQRKTSQSTQPRPSLPRWKPGTLESVISALPSRKTSPSTSFTSAATMVCGT